MQVYINTLLIEKWETSIFGIQVFVITTLFLIKGQLYNQVRYDRKESKMKDALISREPSLGRTYLRISWEQYYRGP